MSEQKRSVSWLLLLGAFLVAGGIGAYFYLQGTWRKLTALESAKAIPEDTMLAAYIDTDSPNWLKLQQFGTPEAQAAIVQGFEQLQNEIFASNQLNYQEDLKPWVGDVMLAILPPSSGSDSNSDSESSTSELEATENPTKDDPNVLLIVGIQNPLKAWLFQRNLQSQSNVTIEKTDYKGVSISVVTVDENAPNYYSAVMGKHLVIAEERFAIEKAVDSYQGDPSFANNAERAEILEAGKNLDKSVAQLYLPNSNSVTQLLREEFSGNAELGKQLDAIKYIVVEAEIEEAGMHIQAIAKVEPEAFTQPESVPENVLLLNRFPSETIALVTGQELKRSWQNLVKQTESDPSLQTMFNSFKSAINDNVDLDLDRDIFSWMDGQFALGFISSNEGLLAQVGFGAAFLFETSDRPLAEASLKKIDASLKKNVPLALETDTNTYQGIEVTEWKIPSQNIVLGGHGWLDRNILLMGFGQPMLDVMSEKVASPLNLSANFQAIAGSLPTPNQGYFYLDMDRVMTLVDRVPFPPGSQIPPELLAVLNSIQGVGVTSSWPKSEINQTDMWLAFKPAQ